MLSEEDKGLIARVRLEIEMQEYTYHGHTILLTEIIDRLVAENEEINKKGGLKSELLQEMKSQRDNTYSENTELQSRLSLLEAERDRLRDYLERIKVLYNPNSNHVPAAYDLAVAALESSQPEGREVTKEEMSQEITRAEEEWLDMPDSVRWEKALATRLLEVFDIRKREG